VLRRAAVVPDLAERLVEQARADGVELVGPGGLWAISPSGSSRPAWRQPTISLRHSRRIDGAGVALAGLVVVTLARLAW